MIYDGYTEAVIKMLVKDWGCTRSRAIELVGLKDSIRLIERGKRLQSYAYYVADEIAESNL